MKKKFVFCHGFSCTPSFWKNMCSFFTSEECYYWDLGYYNNFDVHFLQPQPSTKIIGIGHSLGLLKLVHCGMKFDLLIGINGFINFLGNNEQLRKKRQRELKVLKNSYIKDAQKAIINFIQRCGLSVEELSINLNSVYKAQLLQDLDFLEKDLKRSLPPTCIIAAEDDMIVPKVLVEDNFDDLSNVKQIFLKTGGHSLGFHCAGQIKLLIDDFLNEKL